jgi:hypothetical protein
MEDFGKFCFSRGYYPTRREHCKEVKKQSIEIGKYRVEFGQKAAFSGKTYENLVQITVGLIREIYMEYVDRIRRNVQ